MAGPFNSIIEASSFDKTFKTKGRIYARRLSLAKAVQKRKHVLFGSGGGTFSDDGSGSGSANNKRRDAWEEVRQELLRKGFSEFASKSRLDIQKTDWQHVRRYVMDKRKRDSPNKDEPITELDTVVFDIVKTFGRYSTHDSVGDNNMEDSDLVGDEHQMNSSYTNRSITASPDPDYKADGTDNLPQLSQLLNFQFQPQQSSSPQPETSTNIQTRILEARLQREQYLSMQEKERLTQEQIKTKLLLAQLMKESPEMAAEFEST